MKLETHWGNLYIYYLDRIEVDVSFQILYYFIWFSLMNKAINFYMIVKDGTYLIHEIE